MNDKSQYMIFHSAEIRWFDRNPDSLWPLFETAPPRGDGYTEEQRSDLYLGMDNLSAGIKIRQGRLEIKIKNRADSHSAWGIVQCWTKWSYPENQGIANLIPDSDRHEWLEIIKQRKIKKYDLGFSSGFREINDEIVTEGCTLEFTRLEIPLYGECFFTLGLEAFSQSGIYAENLVRTLEFLELPIFPIKQPDIHSYPELIRRFKHLRT